MEENYFVISASGGDVYIAEIDKAEMERRINDKYYGSGNFRDEVGDTIGEDYDVNYWGDPSYICIKGKIVTPRPVTTVTKFEIE